MEKISLDAFITSFDKMYEEVNPSPRELTDNEKGVLFLMQRMMPIDDTFSSVIQLFVSNYAGAIHCGQDVHSWFVKKIISACSAVEDFRAMAEIKRALDTEDEHNES